MRVMFLAPAVLLSLLLVPATGAAKKKNQEAAPTVLESVGQDMPYRDFASFKTQADAAMANKEDPSALAPLFVQAMVARSLDKKLGESMMGYIVLDKYRKEDSSSESGWTITKIFREELAEPDAKPRILMAYCGGTPEGNYRDHDYNNCSPEIDRQYSSKMQGPRDERAKYFVTNLGASRPRPMSLKYENDQWRVYTVSGLMTGIAATAEETAAKKK